MRTAPDPFKPDGARLPPCCVCGFKATGFHYGVNSCEACKGFFHRSLRCHKAYRCRSNRTSGTCEYKPGKRKSCQYCRFKRCLQAGMSKDAIKTGRYSIVKKCRDDREIRKFLKSADKEIHGDNLPLSSNSYFEMDFKSEMSESTPLRSNENDSAADDSMCPGDKEDVKFDLSLQVHPPGLNTPPRLITQIDDVNIPSIVEFSQPSLPLSLDSMLGMYSPPDSARSDDKSHSDNILSPSVLSVRSETSQQDDFIDAVSFRSTSLEEEVHRFQRNSPPVPVVPKEEIMLQDGYFPCSSQQQLLSLCSPQKTISSHGEISCQEDNIVHNDITAQQNYQTQTQTPQNKKAMVRYQKYLLDGNSQPVELRLRTYVQSTDPKFVLPDILKQPPPPVLPHLPLHPQVSRMFTHYEHVLQKLIAADKTFFADFSEVPTQEIETEQQKYMALYRFKKEQFGRLEWIPVNDYRAIYTMTGLEVDCRMNVSDSYSKRIDLYFRGALQFAHHIPGFSLLDPIDQHKRIKASLTAVCIINSYRFYDLETAVGLNFGGWLIFKDEVSYILQDCYCDVIKCCDHLQKMNVSKEEFTMMKAMLIMTADLENDSNPSLTREINCNLGELLGYVVSQRYSNHQDVLIKLMDYIADVNRLGKETDRCIAEFISVKYGKRSQEDKDPENDQSADDSPFYCS